LTGQEPVDEGSGAECREKTLVLVWLAV
jgi:hypothetical protein